MASRQHQRLLMAGGAFAIAAALGLLWYERHSRRGRRRRGVGDPPGSRDLVLVDDDDDGLDEPDDELRQVFDEAASLARSTIPGGALDRRDQLMLYGLYKQSTEGDRKEGGAVSRLLMMVIVVVIHYLIILYIDRIINNPDFPQISCTSKPSNLNVVAYAKYDAWGKFKGLPKQFAMRKVIHVVLL